MRLGASPCFSFLAVIECDAIADDVMLQGWNVRDSRIKLGGVSFLHGRWRWGRAHEIKGATVLVFQTRRQGI